VRLLRDALQSRILVEIFRDAMEGVSTPTDPRTGARAAPDFVLKGGLAMRAAHGSHRFTKDIDLDSPPSTDMHRAQALVRAAIKRAVAAAGAEVIENVVVTEPKQTETTLRWKVNGTTPDGTPVNVTVEVSRRGGVPVDNIRPYAFPTFFGLASLQPESLRGVDAPVPAPSLSVLAYDGQAMAANKTFALVSENRVAPRDLYDLDILIRAEVEAPIALISEKGPEAAQKALNELWSKLDIMTWSRFREEVLPYLSDDERSRHTEDSFEDMRIRVGERVQGWLEAAIASTGAGMSPSPASPPSAPSPLSRSRP
jgi:hypothetical protein